MPNGGSDCCGTCWFNRVNGGRDGHPEEPGAADTPPFCQIRDLEIRDPFWTYCANHPHHNPARIDVPVGPVFICDDYPYVRKVWVESPDTAEVRDRLLKLLDTMPEIPAAEYPSPTSFDELVIDQLTAFDERRAISGLRRILSFDPSAVAPGDILHRSRVVLVGHAVEALARLGGDSELDAIARCLQYGLQEQRPLADYSPDRDSYAAIRYHAVRGLQFCTSDEAKAMLESALNDPHPEVVSFAHGIIDRTN